ncbi:MAG TPA: hypothetical protein VJ875_13200 [Pyrinomonadaceae bacterium]|nr:hypothetical protein [Pyrinomonadaceae bacterium]
MLDASTNALLSKKDILIRKLSGERKYYQCGITIFLKPGIAGEKPEIGKEVTKGLETVRR